MIWKVERTHKSICTFAVKAAPSMHCAGNTVLDNGPLKTSHSKMTHQCCNSFFLSWVNSAAREYTAIRFQVSIFPINAQSHFWMTIHLLSIFFSECFSKIDFIFSFSLICVFFLVLFGVISVIQVSARAISGCLYGGNFHDHEIRKTI